MIIVLQIVALACVIGGILLMAKKNRLAWLVYEAGGVAWVTLYIKKGLYIAVLAQLIFMALNICGWIQWGKNERTS